MPRSTRRVFGVVAWLPLAACSKEAPTLILKDTEGRSIAALCGDEGKGPCEYKHKGGPKWPAGAETLTTHGSGMLVGMCNVAAGSAVPENASFCRALECKKNTDCPPAHGSPFGACIDGLCTEPAHAFHPDDTVMLCLAGLGLGNGETKHVERYAIGLNCGSPCAVPTPCRKWAGR